MTPRRRLKRFAITLALLPIMVVVAWHMPRVRP